MTDRWKVYCVTEKEFIFTDSALKPHTCPRDSNHPINSLYTTLVSPSEKEGLREVRFSPPFTFSGSIWETLAGFRVPTNAKFQVFSIATAASAASGAQRTDFKIRLYEPTTAQTLTELRWTTQDSGVNTVTSAGLVQVMESRNFQKIEQVTSEYIYLEIQVASLAPAPWVSSSPGIQEIIIQWK